MFFILKEYNEADESGDKISPPAEHRWVYLLLPGLERTTERGGWEGTDRTQFLWRKPSETEANICTGPPLPRASMSRLFGLACCNWVSSHNQGLSMATHPPFVWARGVKEGPERATKQLSNQLRRGRIQSTPVIKVNDPLLINLTVTTKGGSGKIHLMKERDRMCHVNPWHLHPPD